MLRSGNKDESTVWLSAIIQEIWPYAASIAQSTLLEYVQPALEAAVPAGLPVPRFTKLLIGEDAVRVQHVRVFERKYGHGDVGVVMEADVAYDGNPKIEMAIGEFPFGVTNAKLQGRVEILLRPLLNRLPLFGAVQMGFINPPKLDYTLTGLASFGNQSTIRSIITNVSNEVVASMGVLPNRVAYKAIPTTDFFHFSAQPVGVLRVAALSGSGFPATDRHPLKQAFGLSEMPDVYLSLRHGSKVFSTKHVADHSAPVWRNEIFDFVLTSESSSQKLQVEAYDSDVGTDDFLGRANVLVSDLVKQGESQISLEDSPEEAKPTVQLSARWLHLSSDLCDIQNAIMMQRSDKLRPTHCSSALLTVEIDEAHKLPEKKRPFVRVTVGPHRFQTSAAYDSPGLSTVQDPQFEVSFHASLQGTVDASMQIEYQVLDLYSGELLGHAYSSLAEAVEARSTGRTYEFALLGAEKAGASLRVRVKLEAVLDDPPLWEVLAETSRAS